MENQGKALAQELGEGAFFCPLNVRYEGEWKIISEKIIIEFGCLDILVNKAGIRTHTKSVALHCAEKGYNIRCNSIHPAAIMTPWDAIFGEGDTRTAIIKSVEDGIPMGKFGEPIEVGYAALFLASEGSKYITGIELKVNGGILAGAEARPENNGS